MIHCQISVHAAVLKSGTQCLKGSQSPWRKDPATLRQGDVRILPFVPPRHLQPFIQVTALWGKGEGETFQWSEMILATGNLKRSLLHPSVRKGHLRTGSIARSPGQSQCEECVTASMTPLSAHFSSPSVDNCDQHTGCSLRAPQRSLG